MPSVNASNISKTFNEEKNGEPIQALTDVSLHIEDNEFVSIIGPSGCGKSTFLMMIAGLETPTKGKITLDGKTIDGPNGSQSIVFQEYLLFPWKTVRQNIEFGPVLKHESRSAFHHTCESLMELVGLTEFANHYPHELSGGMKQRVAIARALACKPKVLLMDEPFGSLDALTREMLQTELQNIWLKTRCMVLFVTHSISEAIFLADRVVVMSKRPGSIKNIVPIELERPRTRDVHTSTAFKEYEQILKEAVWEEVTA